MSGKDWQTFLIFLGIAAILVMRFAPPSLLADVFGPPAGMPSDPDAADVWTTPYYLRYNTNQVADVGYVLPRATNQTFALGVPAQSLTGGSPLTIPTK